jgi:hypothetical protein
MKVGGDRGCRSQREALQQEKEHNMPVWGLGAAF